MLIWIDLCVIASFFSLLFFVVVVTFLVCLFFLSRSLSRSQCNWEIIQLQYVFVTRFSFILKLFWIRCHDVLRTFWCNFSATSASSVVFVCYFAKFLLIFSFSLSRWPLNRNRKNKIYEKYFRIFLLLLITRLIVFNQLQISNKLHTHAHTNTGTRVLPTDDTRLIHQIILQTVSLFTIDLTSRMTLSLPFSIQKQKKNTSHIH